MNKITASIAMGGGGDTTTSTEPPEFLKPYLTGAAKAAEAEFSTGQRNLPPDQSGIAPINEVQKQAQQMLLQYATGGVNTPQQPNYFSPTFSNMAMSVAAPTPVNSNASLPSDLLPVQGQGKGIIPARPDGPAKPIYEVPAAAAVSGWPADRTQALTEKVMARR